MDQINTKELGDASIYPDSARLQAILGDSFEAYNDLLRLFDNNGLDYGWRYYKDGKAWLCKVQKKKKTIVWMSAWQGFMKATIYFSNTYVDDLLTLELSERTKKTIVSTKNVGKSKPCTFEIRDKGILQDFEMVMLFKIRIK